MILDRVLEGRQVVVCAGAGGVGKTTVAAALGSQLASRGGRVLVLTIDPARRLAGALGLPDHGDDAHEVDLAARRAQARTGSLHAAMLDAQLTFDRLVREQAPSEAAAERILANRDLPAGVGRGRRRSRVHGDGAALRAPHERRVRRDRARHAAVAKRARLPRGARPADAVRRGPGAAVPAPAGNARRAAGLLGGRADRRRHVPARPVGARGRVRGHVRGLRPPGRPRCRRSSPPTGRRSCSSPCRRSSRWPRRTSSGAPCASGSCRSAG